MRFSSQAKVGAVALIALALFVGIFKLMGGCKKFRQKGYEFDIVFDRVEGLPPGTPVRLAGVGIGSVKSISLNEKNQPIVKVMITPMAKIDRNTKFRIVVEGIVGQKIVEVLPQQPPKGENIAAGDIVGGGSAPVSVDDLMTGARSVIERVNHLVESIDKLLGDERLMRDLRTTTENVAKSSEEIHKMLSSVNGILSDKQLLEHVRNSVANASEATRQIAALARNMREVGDENRGRINATVASVEKTAQQASDLLAKANQILDEPTRGNLQDLIKNLKEASTKIDEMTESLNEIISDPEIKSDIKDTISTTKEMAGKADRAIGAFTNMIETFNDTTLSPSFEIRYIPDLSLTQADMGVRIYPPKSLLYYLVGLDDVGESQETTLQLGVPLKPGSWLRAGLKSKKLGIGFDLNRGGYIFKADLIDPNNIKLNLRFGFRIKNNLYILTGVEDAFLKHNFSFGVEQRY